MLASKQPNGGMLIFAKTAGISPSKMALFAVEMYPGWHRSVDVHVRTFEPDKPGSTLSKIVETYTFLKEDDADWHYDVSIFLDEPGGKWLMFYQKEGGNPSPGKLKTEPYRIKTAPVVRSGGS